MRRSRQHKGAIDSLRQVSAIAVCALLLTATARCARTGPTTSAPNGTTLRIGSTQLASASATNGMPQLVQILSAEGLVRIGEDGRPVARLAQGWDVSADGLSITVHLRPQVSFHDGTPVTAVAIATALSKSLPEFMGPAFSDVERITAANEMAVEIKLRRRSPFVLEALEAPVWKPGATRVGTGPYMAVGPSAPNELRANSSHYLGPPAIDHIVVSPYPSVRAQWADLLRDRIDMLFEVGVDALDSLKSAKNITVYTEVRHYQYVLVFNTKSGPLHSGAVRRALNEGVDRDALIRDAFGGHAVASSGLIWPQHWAFPAQSPSPSFNPSAAAAVVSGETGGNGLRFSCLVFPWAERIGLVLKQQLEAVGVDMTLQEAPGDVILQALEARDFDAVLLEVVSAPSLFRPYLIWHSGGNIQPRNLGNQQLDAAFDRIRNAADDNDYRAAVADLQKLTVEDPPAIFLAWTERARAVSGRFGVTAEPGLDVLTTLRLWRPTNAQQAINRN